MSVYEEIDPVWKHSLPQNIASTLLKISSSIQDRARTGLSLLEEHVDIMGKEKGWRIGNQKSDVHILISRKEQ